MKSPESVARAAWEISCPESRTDYLDASCGDDTTLRTTVEQMLADMAEADDFLDGTPIGKEAIEQRQADPDENSGDLIDRYKLLEKLGEGGFGAVWAAEQKEPVKRRVALKIIKLGMDTHQVVARFEAERQALALMDHPNIAKVLDAGATSSGRPYFVMELVRGISITDYCSQEKLDTRDRLELFIKVCHAIQHAHQKGLIHRDIKPSNILVTLHDGVPVPKVIDFGIAKATQQELTEMTIYTRHHQFIGTPAYMSPEQAEMSGLDTDTRSDVYSLGVLLYELLAGSTPFDSQELVMSGIDEMRRIIRETEPDRPSTKLSRTVEASAGKSDSRSAHRIPHSAIDKDLDWIVMKCLEKDRTRRYDTAKGLAIDLLRHLNNEPVVARPPSMAYRCQRAWRRNKLAYTAVAAVTLALVLGTGISLWQAISASRAKVKATKSQLSEMQQRIVAQAERDRALNAEAAAHENADEARRNLYASDMNLAYRAIRESNYGRAYHLLAGHIPSGSGEDLRGWEWRHLWRECQSDEIEEIRQADQRTVWSVAFSPKNNGVVASAYDSVVQIKLRSGETIYLNHPSSVSGLVFAPDGSYLVSGCHDKTIRFWNYRNGDQLKEPIRCEDPVWDLAFFADGSRLAAATDEKLVIWNLTGNKPEIRRQFTTNIGPIEGLPVNISLSPDGRWVAIGSDAHIAVFDLQGAEEVPIRLELQPVKKLFFEQLDVVGVAFSPDSRRLATVDYGGNLSVFERQDGKWILANTIVAHVVWASSVAFSPNGELLFTAGADQLIKFWNATTLENEGVLKGHHDEIWSLKTSSDGSLLVTGAKDGAVKLWNGSRGTQSRRKTVVLPRNVKLYCTSGRRFAGGLDSQSKLSVYETRDLQSAGTFQLLWKDVTSFALANEAGLAATGHDDGVIRVFHLGDDVSLATLLTGHSGQIHNLEFSADSKWLISDAQDRSVRLWESKTGHEVRHWDDVDSNRFASGSWEATSFSFSSDDALFTLPNGKTRSIEIWSLLNRKRLASHRFSKNGIFAQAAILPGNEVLAVAGTGGYLTLQNVSADTPLTNQKSQLLGLHALAVSPTGDRIAVGTSQEGVRLWSSDGRSELLVLEPGHPVDVLAFSPDGESLIAGTKDRLTLFRAPSLDDLEIEPKNTTKSGD